MMFDRAARPGHLIYCYGNCNRDVDTNDLDALEDAMSGEDLLKKYWLEAIERPCEGLRQCKRTNKKVFSVRFCD